MRRARPACGWLPSWLSLCLFAGSIAAAAQEAPGAAQSAPSPAASAPAIAVRGSRFVDASGAVVQLRGVNISGFEFWAIKGQDPATTLATQTGSAAPWAAIKSWGANAVRLPLNETSWNANDRNASCIDSGATVHPDPHGNYRGAVSAAVDAASAAGLFVILDLQWTAPAGYCALALNPMADLDNAPRFWRSVAATFQGYRNVLFDLFNEPFAFPWPDWNAGGQGMWGFWRDGGTLTQYVASGGNVALRYQAAGMQQLLDAVRATGARNVVLVSAMTYANDMSGWLGHRPRDPLDQIAVGWHVYPANTNAVDDTLPASPTGGSAQLREFAPLLLASGFPVVISEFGDQMTGTAPLASMLLPWADGLGISYLGWTWNNWPGGNIYSPHLIADGAGTPAPGFGAYTRAHFLCRAAGTAVCP